MVVDGGMDAAAAITALIALNQVGSNLQSIGQSAGRLYESTFHLGDYFKFIEMDLPERKPAAAIPAFDRLDVRDVHFSYPGANREALQGVSMQIKSGEVIALVGENGSGKTTLAKLLANLYTPAAGEITWDGTSTMQLEADAMRRNVAVILQDFVRS